ncbi:hypothetical protein BT96DRAFT_841740, partial [Gymnopus androsaceus JB14]
WKAVDQEIFILALLFNPYIWNKVFNKTKLSHTDLWHITCCTFLWFTGVNPCPSLANLEFLQAFDDYILNHGSFSDATIFQGCIVDLLALWCCQGATNVNGCGGLMGIALCILQMVGNLASTECIFSVFGLTHSSMCNWLAPDTVHDLTIVRMDCHHEHKAAGVVYTCRKCRFGDLEPEAEPTGMYHEFLTSLQPCSISNQALHTIL